VNVNVVNEIDYPQHDGDLELVENHFVGDDHG
jgi:hypothetical protein